MTGQLPVTMHDDQGGLYKDRSDNEVAVIMVMAARPAF